MARNIGSNNCLPTAAIFSRFVASRRVACGESWFWGGVVREGCCPAASLLGFGELPGDSYVWGALSLPLLLLLLLLDVKLYLTVMLSNL